MRNVARRVTALVNRACFATAVAVAPLVVADDGTAAGEWRHHGGDHASTKYSSLSQIDAGNFSKIEVAWRWKSADRDIPYGDGGRYYTGDYRATPLMVGGRVYAATSHGQVAALDPATGEQLWLYDPKSYAKGQPNMQPLQTRGIEYWTDGKIERIFVATLGKQLVSIDIATGKPDPNFGDNGIVDLAGDLGPGDFEINNITHGAPPIVVADTVVVGSKIFDYGMHNNSPPGTHPRLRRPDGQVQVALPHHSAGGRTLRRDLGERLLEKGRQHQRLVDARGRRRVGAGLPADFDADQRTTGEASDPVPMSTPRASFASTQTPASVSGTSRLSTTGSGTTMSPPLPTSWMSSSTVNR